MAASDPGEQVATIGAGAKWSDVVGPAAEHGLAALHGSSGTVGVAGYTVSGGLGWLARSRGFACNSVRGMEVVTADGEIRRVGPDSEPDLFWALRGGGGTHAISTSFDHGLVELAEAYAGSLMWPIEKAGEARFLPILLTTLTALGGLLPIALEGSALYSPLAWVIIGGLITSTVLTRVVTPVVYKLLAPEITSGPGYTPATGIGG